MQEHTLSFSAPPSTIDRQYFFCHDAENVVALWVSINGACPRRVRDATPAEATTYKEVVQ